MTLTLLSSVSFYFLSVSAVFFVHFFRILLFDRSYSVFVNEVM